VPRACWLTHGQQLAHNKVHNGNTSNCAGPLLSKGMQNANSVLMWKPNSFAMLITQLHTSRNHYWLHQRLQVPSLCSIPAAAAHWSPVIMITP
jgi:hypothetical protein